MKKLFGQILKFGIVGVINTILSLVIYWSMVNNGIHYLIANATGFVITVALAYFLNELFTFKNSEGKRIGISVSGLLKSYISYFLTGVVINSAMLWFWNDLLGINKNIAPVLNLIITVPLNFLFSKLWIFDEKKQSKGKKSDN